MQSIIDSTILISIVVLCYIVVFYLFHKFFYWLGFERGLLSEKLTIGLFFVPAILFFVLIPGNVDLLLSGSMADLGAVLFNVFITLGVGATVVVGCGLPIKKKNEEEKMPSDTSTKY